MRLAEELPSIRNYKRGVIEEKRIVTERSKVHLFMFACKYTGVSEVRHCLQDLQISVSNTHRNLHVPTDFLPDVRTYMLHLF